MFRVVERTQLYVAIALKKFRKREFQNCKKILKKNYIYSEKSKKKSSTLDMSRALILHNNNAVKLLTNWLKKFPMINQKKFFII